MMVLDRLTHHVRVWDLSYNLGSDLRMQLYLKEFFVVERSGLVKDLLQHKNLSHVVNPGRENQIGSLFR